MRTSSARVRQCSASLRKDWLVMPGSVCESVIVMVRLAGAGRLHQLYAANERVGSTGSAQERHGRATYICRPSNPIFGSGNCPNSGPSTFHRLVRFRPRLSWRASVARLLHTAEPRATYAHAAATTRPLAAAEFLYLHVFV